MNNNEFKPFIPASEKPAEFTATSIILGILLAVIFGGANAYLGLRVGLTISASIPAAVISMGVIRAIMHKDSILENNMVQTIGSAGESLAAGAIFTIPVLFMWSEEWGEDAPSILTITLLAFLGGTLGVLFMVPLRRSLIVKEHGVLPYPEGTACAKVLLSGEDEEGSKSKTVFLGLGISAAYKFITDGLKLFPSEINWDIKPYKGSAFGADVLPALAGVGFICGSTISSYMFAGGVVAWFVLMPCIAFFGSDAIIFPGTELISTFTPSALWSNYIRYIGAGAVAAGGIFSLVKSLPLIVNTFVSSIKSLKDESAGNVSRTERDLPINIVLIGVAVLVLLIAFLPTVPVGILGAVMIVVFGFFFATVSSRMVGLVGSSNNPVSGMAIACLLVSTLLLKVTGNTGHTGMIAAIAIGSIVCIISAMAGDTSQDLKTGYILGATPIKQQIGELIGTVVAAISIGGVMYLLNSAWGFGTAELAAPQASLMKMVVEGVMNANLPWALVFMGVFIAVMAEILKIPVLPFAIGLYLPIHLSTPIFVGGLLRLYYEKTKRLKEEDREDSIDNGVLFSSGLIAGEGLVGILLAVFAVANLNVDISGIINLGNIGGLVFFAGLMALFVALTFKKRKAGK